MNAHDMGTAAGPTPNMMPSPGAPAGPDAALQLAPARRRWLRQASLPALGAFLGGSGLATLAGCSTGGSALAPARATVLVVGGGFGGATAARYLRLFSGGRLDVVLVEPEAQFVSCPMSNLVLGGHATMADIIHGYDTLASRHGVRIVHDSVAAIDPVKRSATLASGALIAWDRLVLSPGVEMLWQEVEGLRSAQQQGRVLQAWKAGPETSLLRRQLQDMPDGGSFVIAVPEAPYRCPPGPYERACQVASYFKLAKPRSKVLILDANPDVTSKPMLFKRAWVELYPGMVEYRAGHKAVAVDLDKAGLGASVRFEVQDDEHADVLNVLPPMRAGALAVATGLANANARWCSVDFLSFESTVARGIHVLGDAIQTAPAMPKSGHMANGHAKVAAAAIVAGLSGWDINPQPMLTNTCYSFVDAQRAVHVASVHAYDAAEKTFKTVPGSGGLSAAPNAREGDYAWNWARTTWADMLG